MFQKIIEITSEKSCRETLLTLFEATTESSLSSRIAAHDGSYRFRGRIEGEAFQLVPIVEHRSIFLPTIKGTVKENGNGSQITVKLALSPSALLLLWVLTVLCIAIGFPVAFFQPILIFLPFLLLISLWGIASICFRTERKEAEHTLRKTIPY